MKQEMTGWQWNQMDHIQIICTLDQTDDHASTSSCFFMILLLITKNSMAEQEKSAYHLPTNLFLFTPITDMMFIFRTQQTYFNCFCCQHVSQCWEAGQTTGWLCCCHCSLNVSLVDEELMRFSDQCVRTGSCLHENVPSTSLQQQWATD